MNRHERRKAFALEPGLLRPGKLTVQRDLTGGARIAVGDRSFVLAPEDAVGFARGILEAVGINVMFGPPPGLPS
jgi:hypothetical protein